MEKYFKHEKDLKSYYCYIKNNVIYKIEEINKSTNVIKCGDCVKLLDKDTIPFCTYNGEKLYFIDFIEIGDCYSDEKGFTKTIHDENGEIEVTLSEFILKYYNSKLNESVLLNVNKTHLDFINFLRKNETSWSFLVDAALDIEESLDGIEQIPFSDIDFVDAKRKVITEECKRCAIEKAIEYNKEISKIDIVFVD